MRSMCTSESRLFIDRVEINSLDSDGYTTMIYLAKKFNHVSERKRFSKL